MRDSIWLLYAAAFVGIVATAFMDVVAFMRTRLLHAPAANYGLVGRWMLHVARGRFRHDAISRTAPVTGEMAVGWVAHYLIGVVFAGILLAVSGSEWLCEPTVAPALITGVVSVAAPFLIMQPGMGLGIAASRAPNPAQARVRSLMTHASFGIGLYVGGVVARAMQLVAC